MTRKVSCLARMEEGTPQRTGLYLFIRKGNRSPIGGAFLAGREGTSQMGEKEGTKLLRKSREASISREGSFLFQGKGGTCGKGYLSKFDHGKRKRLTRDHLPWNSRKRGRGGGKYLHSPIRGTSFLGSLCLSGEKRKVPEREPDA